MRSLLIAMSLASIAIVTYVLAPDFMESQTKPIANQTNQTNQVLETVANSVAPPAWGHTEARPRTPASAIRPSTLAPSPTRSQAVTQAPKPRVALRRKAQVQNPEAAALASATGLVPARDGVYRPSEIVASNDPERAPRVSRNLSNPMRDRWISELSGDRARLSMGKQKADQDCSDEFCEREPAPKDISVAGVVVKTETLRAHPTAPLEGNIRRGHYQKHTPAVYVE